MMCARTPYTQGAPNGILARVSTFYGPHTWAYSPGEPGPMAESSRGLSETRCRLLTSHYQKAVLPSWHKLPRNSVDHGYKASSVCISAGVSAEQVYFSFTERSDQFQTCWNQHLNLPCPKLSSWPPSSFVTDTSILFLGLKTTMSSVNPVCLMSCLQSFNKSCEHCFTIQSEFHHSHHLHSRNYKWRHPLLSPGYGNIYLPGFSAVCFPFPVSTWQQLRCSHQKRQPYTVAPPLKHLTAHLSPHSGRAEVLTLICRPVRPVLSYFSDSITYFPSLLFSPLHSGRPPRSSDTSASGPVLFPLPPLARCLHLESLFLHVSLSNSFPKVSWNFSLAQRVTVFFQPLFIFICFS